MTNRRIGAFAAALVTAMGLYAALRFGVHRDPLRSTGQKPDESRDGNWSPPPRRPAPQVTAVGDAPEGAEGVPIPEPPPGYGVITCDLDLDSAGTMTGSLKLEDRLSRRAFLINDQLVAVVPAGSGTARFDFDVAEGSFAWHGLTDGGSGTCSERSVDTLFTGLYGRLKGQPFPNARVTGCGGDVPIDRNDFFMMVQAPRECDVVVTVATETEFARGVAVRVRTISGEDSEVVISYPLASDFGPIPPELAQQRRDFADIISASLEREAESTD